MAQEVNASCAECASPRPGSGALAALLIFTIVADVLGNALVILSVYRNKKLRNAGNIFVVSLSVADLVVALYPYPLALLAIFHGGWTLDAVQCQLSGFVLGLGVIGSVFNITAIAINRYCYICHTLRYERCYTRRNTCLCVSLTWLLSVVATLPNFLLGSLTYDPRVFSCTFTQTVSSSYTASVVLVHFMIPLAIVSFCYLRIWMLVIRVKGRVRARPWTRATDLRHFLTMFVVFVLFAVCWAPLNFIGLAVALDPINVAPKVPEWLFVASYFLAYFNSCLNAAVYGFLNQNFRREYKQILLSLCTPRALFHDSSRCNSDPIRSKQSPAVTNNIAVEAHL
ncbi:melatonin receptor type 1C [Clarias gariepinus]|uniref:melatonin receptor type 1C n=1 Tax=Clarias gariepinus TaxID=13013 RepID=UPI00234D9D82|nr:melatonin receptor type 1C [Clarias gariepinus]